MLAHVDVGPIAASCFEPAWIRAAEARLGPARDRELGEDAKTLARLFGDHDALASAQAIAWRFETTEDVRAAAGKELFDPATEVLRAAAELELEAIAAWSFEPGEIPDLALAPTTCTIQAVRPLPRRGRAMDDRIFVGAPGIAGADPWHVAFQAAHEAIVLVTPGDFVTRERNALALLRARARAAGLATEHAAWLATMNLDALGPIPDEADGI